MAPNLNISRKYRFLVTGRFDEDDVRLDDAQRVFFAKELEHVDTQVYGMLMPELRMRTLVPTIQGIPDHKNAYTYRTSTEVGEAELSGAAADDVPMVEVSQAETSQAIKKYVLGYYYDDDEIIAARAEGVNLDVDRAMACRRGLERKVDRVLALGDSKVGSVGLLNVSVVSADTAGAKAKGGTGWGTVGAPNATGKEAAADVMGLAATIVADSKEAIQRVVIAMPIAKKQFLAEVPYQPGSDTTILKYILANSPNIEAIESLDYCTGAGVDSSDRMVGYARDRRVIGGLVNREFTSKPPTPKNYRWDVIASMKCGGVVVRYKVGMRYRDKI